MEQPDSTTRIAILGAGLIGTAWAALFRHHGFDVRIWDPAPEALDSAEARMTIPLAQLAEIASDAGRSGTLTLCKSLEDAVTGAAAALPPSGNRDSIWLSRNQKNSSPG